MDNNRVNVNVSEGKLIGIITENVYGDKYIAFRGIPYAKPPVGELRFKDPVLPEPWSGNRDASKFGNNAVQLDIFLNQIIGNEDCLYLNVYTTNINPEKKRPVMVWIHGGAFYMGSGDATFYGPDYIVKKEVVLVTLNYRLGVLGFLNLNDKVATGNQGLKDIVMALQWVQKNISNFGGDQRNVTIFGESAGGAAVHYLTISPLAEGLFHKAISQSGAATNPWAFTEREPPSMNKGFQLAAKLGKATTNAKVAYEFLKKIDAKKLIQTEQQDLLTEEERQQFLLAFTPSMDNESSNPFFPKPIKTLINRGVKVPLIVGYTNAEGTFFIGSDFNDLSKKEALEQVNSDFKRAILPNVLSKLPEIPITVEELRFLYFGDKAVSEETLKNYADFFGDEAFYRGLIEVVDIQIKSGHSSTYLYNFSYENENCPERKVMSITLPGVAHGEDLCYLFYPHMMKDLGFVPPELNSEEYKVISRFVQMWTDFAKTGNPTPTITDLIPVKWEPMKDGDTYNYLSIDTELRMKTLRKKEQRWDWKNIKMKLLRMIRSSSSAFAVTLCQTTDILTLFSRHPFNIYIMDNNRVNVNVSEGKLIGIITENVYGDKYIAFRGIPYAKPPVGELRFKDPVLPESWSGDRDASKFENNAVQLDIFTQQITGNEDCLYLNVYTTNINLENKRPVMVWIHGGGFFVGSGDDTFYGPDHIVQKNVVLVTLNYRLGVLGFLNLYDKVATGNQGLKDVIMALQWVQKNISNFGGDSRNVTIFGESAGAATVHYLTISPLAEGLFHKAIAQSGAATNPWAFTEREPPSTNKGFQLAEKLGKATTDAKIAYEFLKKIDAKKLIQTEQQDLLTEEERQQSLVTFTPSMDNESSNPVFPKPINTLINRGIKVPLLVGYTNDEGLFVKSIFSARRKKEVLEQVNSDFKKAITSRILSTLPEIPITVEELRSLYFGDKAVSEETLKNYVDFNGDQEFYRGLMEAVDIQIKSGHSSTYLYNFSYENENCPMRKMMGITLPGVCHAEDLYYLFYPHMIKDLGFLPPELDSEEYKVISRFVQMWTDFAKTGNPTPTITNLIPVKWEPLKNGDTYNYLNIDTELRIKTLRKKEQRWDWKNMKIKL
ncbi:uncharacterized protein [Linepithema humile]|uniref:uncharacterized protein n=1 Tax=Linepithema humile TaxID=83485 RepID=UPI00351F4FB1